MKGLLFTYLLTYGGAVASFFNPFTGLLIYICFAIIKPEALWYWSVPQGNYSRIVFVAVLVGWALSGFGSWQFGRARALMVGICGYMAWWGISATQAPDQTLAWNHVEATAKIVLPVIVGISLIDSMERLRQVAWVIIASQGFLALEFNMSYYDGFNRITTIGFAGMEEKSVAIPMVSAASLAVFMGLSTRHWAVKALTVVAALLMIHVPLFTFSRNGMLALGVSAVAIFVLIKKRASHVFLIVMVVALGLRLAGPEVREKFSTTFASEEERDGSAQSRIDLWAQAWETMLQHPIVGLGPRHWGAHAKAEYGWASEKEVHNTWLQIGAELGFPAFIAIVVFFFLTVWRCWPLARGRLGADADEADIARMVICALAGYAVTSQFITAYGLEVPFYVAMMGAGLLKIRSARAQQPQRAPAPVFARPGLSPAPLPAPRAVTSRASAAQRAATRSLVK